MPRRVEFHRTSAVPPAAASYEAAAGRKADKRFYASTPWRRLREAFLRRNPLCEACRAQGRLTAAEHAHHRKARRDHPDLALDWGNLQALCQPCHNAMPER